VTWLGTVFRDGGSVGGRSFGSRAAPGDGSSKAGQPQGIVLQSGAIRRGRPFTRWTFVDDESFYYLIMKEYFKKECSELEYLKLECIKQKHSKHEY